MDGDFLRLLLLLGGGWIGIIALIALLRSLGTATKVLFEGLVHTLDELWVWMWRWIWRGAKVLSAAVVDWIAGQNETPMDRHIRREWRKCRARGERIGFREFRRQVLAEMARQQAENEERAQQEEAERQRWEDRARRKRQGQHKDEQHQERQREEEPPKPPPAAGSAFVQACRVLGMDESGNFTREECQKRYRRLVQATHPDREGSTFLAAQINQARDVIWKAKGWT